MVYTQTSTPAVQWQAPPVVAELQALFARLDDQRLLTALAGPPHRGPKGHPVRVLWHCFVAKYSLGLPSTDAMIRTLRNNPFIAQACGINSPDAIPHKSTFSLFFKKLASQKVLPRLKDVSRALVRQQYATLPGFGQRVAMDSTTLKAWSNGGKPRKADKEASWSIKKGTQGRKEFVYGWKLHLLVDCEYELPIAANVTTGSVHDSQRATNLLREARFAYSCFKPKYLMADQGYSGKHLNWVVKHQFKAIPIIQVNKGHKKLMAQLGKFQAMPEWKALYKQRQAVERVFSRLKGQRSLNRITVRKKMKVTAHCYLSLIAMQANSFA
ncbi:MAG: transposase [Dehalococcoidia bacterium]